MPRGKVAVAKVALPPAKMAVPIEAPLLSISTVPVGMPALGLTAATVIAKVTDWPNTDGLTLEVTMVVLAAWSGSGWGEEKVNKAKRDISKEGVIEPPTAGIVKNSATVESKDTTFVNPKVEPGAVKWHATLDDACKASAQSGKPVLLFQLMGNLDEKFC